MSSLPGPPEIVSLDGAARDELLPVLKEGFEGIYRWHAKRTLHRIELVRGARIAGAWAGFSLLEMLVPEAGYVYYIAVGTRFRRQGLGGSLLDDALELFRARGAEVVYAAAEEDNVPSRSLFRSRGFRSVERKETGFREGGLGAWGLRSRMMVVSEEVLLGIRLRPHPPGPTGADASGP